MDTDTSFRVIATYADGSKKDFSSDDRVEISFSGPGRSLVERVAGQSKIKAKDGEKLDGKLVVTAT